MPNPVTTVNGLLGPVTLAAGAGVTVTPSGNTLTVASISAATVFYPESYGAVGNGSTDDSTAINAAIAACVAAGRGVVLFGAKTYKHNSTITVGGGGVTLQGYGGGYGTPATILLYGSSTGDNIFIGAAQPTAIRVVTDGAMTSGSHTLTSATATFVIGDVGSQVVVNGAAAAGANLVTTISARTDGTTVTLTAAAGSAVSNAVTSIGSVPGVMGLQINDIAIQNTTNKTTGAAIHCVNMSYSLIQRCAVTHSGGGKHFDGIFLELGCAVVAVEDCVLYGADPAGITRVGAAVSGTGNVGFRLYGLASTVANGAYPGSDIWLRGRTEVAFWAAGVWAESNVGGLYLDAVIQDNAIGVRGDVRSTPLNAAAYVANREVFFSSLSVIDHNFNYGLYSPNGSWQQVEANCAWFYGNGVYIDGTPIGAGGNIVLGNLAGIAESRWTGCQISASATTGITLNGGTHVITGCRIDGNGVLSGTGGNGIQFGTATAAVVTGNQISNNAQNGGGGTAGLAVYVSGTLTAANCRIDGNSYWGNTGSNGVAGNTTGLLGADEAVLAANFTVTGSMTEVYGSSPGDFRITLPGAGTYRVSVDIRYLLNYGGGAGAYIEAKLYNVTAAADVANGAAMVRLISAADSSQGGAPLSKVITVGVATTIAFYAIESAATAALIVADAGGQTRMAWSRCD